MMNQTVQRHQHALRGPTVEPIKGGTTMKRMMRMASITVLSLLLLAANSAIAAQELPPGPTTIYRSNWAGLTMAGEFEVIDLILEFPPGSVTPSHIHGGPGMATVLEGEVVFTTEGKAGQVTRPGEFYLDVAGSVHTAANQTDRPARVSYVILLPKGAAVTTVMGGPSAGELPPGPKTISRSNWPGLAMAGEFELINLILEFGSGSATPSHIHGGPGMATVLEGEMVFTTEGQPGQIIRPGQFYLDVAGSVHTAANQTASPARVSYVVALPKGAPLTTVSGAPQAPAPAAPGMPRTGAPPALLPLVAALSLGLLSLGCGALARRSRAKRR